MIRTISAVLSFCVLFQTSCAIAEEISIGAIVSFEGGAGEQGRNWLEGAQLAVDDLQRDGIKVRLVVENDSTQSAKAVTSFQKLARIDHVQGVVGGTWDFLAEAVAPLSKSFRIPFVTPSNPKEVLSDSAKANPYVFSNGITLQAERIALRKFLLERPVTSIGIVSVSVPFAEAHNEMVAAIASELKIPVIAKEVISLEEPPSTYKVAAQKLARKKPELVYVLTDYSTIDIFLAELQNLRWSPTVVTTQHLEDGFLLSNSNVERYRNAFAVYPKYDRKRFDIPFLTRFKHPPRVFAANGYDAVQFLARVLHAGIDPALSTSTFEYDGVVGKHRLPTPDRGLVDDEAVIMGFESGVFAEAKHPAPNRGETKKPAE